MSFYLEHSSVKYFRKNFFKIAGRRIGSTVVSLMTLPVL